MAKIRAPSLVLDSGWSWVVCFASFLVQFIVLGIQNSFGTFFIQFLHEFKEAESSTAWIGSIGFGLTFMNGPLATALCVRWGSRMVACLGGVMSVFGLLLTSYVTKFSWLYVTYGLVWGIGASFAYFASIAALTSYFKKHLSLAYGICLAGSGAGTPVLIILLELLNTTYGWRTTFQGVAILGTLVFLCGLTYLRFTANAPRPRIVQKEKDEKLHSGRGCEQLGNMTFMTLRQVSALFFDPAPWRIRAFVFWVPALGFVIFGYFIPFVFVIRMAKDIGVPDTQSALLIAYLAITQTVFKIIFGKIGDMFRRQRIMILQVVLLLQAVATIMCPLATTHGYPVLLAYVLIFGFSDGCWSVMLGMGTELIVGKAMMPRAFGNLYGVIAIPLILGPPVAGSIYDSSGSYDAAFFLSGGSVIVGICLMFVVQRLIVEEPRELVEIVAEREEMKPAIPELECKLIAEYDDGVGHSSSRLDLKSLIRRRNLDVAPPSRPSSLIISRLLGDVIFEEELSYNSNFEIRRGDRHHEATGVYSSSLSSLPTVVWTRLEDYTPTPKNRYGSDMRSMLNSKRTSSDNGIHNKYLWSREGKLQKGDRAGSLDSGRSTGSEEDTSSLISDRSACRSSSDASDSVYEEMTSSTGDPLDQCDSIDSSRPSGVQSPFSIAAFRDTEFESEQSWSLPTCLYSPKEEDAMTDVFSKLMERALEISVVEVQCFNDDPSFVLGHRDIKTEPQVNFCRSLESSPETVL